MAKKSTKTFIFGAIIKLLCSKHTVVGIRPNTMPEQLLNILKIIFEKLKNGFLVSKMGKINFLEDYNIPKNLSFGGHI